MPQKFIITIDLGGTKMLGCALNSRKKIFTRIKYPTYQKSNEQEHINSLVKLVNKILSEGNLDKKNIKAICLGVPGSVNPYTGKIGLAPNLGLRNFNIKKPLDSKLKIPVLIENDVNLAAIGIKKFEAKKNISD
ncbi:MAG: ROK family protein, partial [Nitrososphaeraceae archaeon]|nr:ROK family protein [Nitrososphaeraceae archaeon]